MLYILRRFQRPLALCILFAFCLTLLPVTNSYALSSGPSQPETQQFAPAGMDNMVDPFTGDFSYNIPLMDVGGYPLNLNYAAGITPDQEATWVGLGWNLNVGSINRSMRGLPDDFKGENVDKSYYTRPNQTFGMSTSASVELYGYETGSTSSASIGLNVKKIYTYNTYTGIGVSHSVSPSVALNKNQKSPWTGSLGIDFSLGSESGLGVTPKVGLSYKQKSDNDENSLGASLSLPYNSRDGLKGMSLSASFTNKASNGFKTSVGGGSAYLGHAWPAYTPTIQHSGYNINFSTGIELAFPNVALEPGLGAGIQYSGQFLKNTDISVPSYGYMYAADAVGNENALQDFNREKDGGFTEYTKNLPVPSHTYDVFGVSGQGVAGSYRLRRGDVGTIHDVRTDEVAASPNIGVDIEFGGPPVVLDVGVDLSYNQMNSVSGPFSVGSDFVPALPKFKKTAPDQLAEMVYFKKMGEKSVETDPDYKENALYSQALVRPVMAGGNYGIIQNKVQEIPKNYNDPVAAGNRALAPPAASHPQRNARENRSESFITLTAAEASKSGISTDIKNYPIQDADPANIISKANVVPEPRVDGNKKAHHISEIRVTGDNGSRYIYATPVYNFDQQDVTYAIGTKNTPDAEYNALLKNGLYSYSSGDDKTYNGNGASASYNKVKTPPYATSYLLTTLLSADYADSDDEAGPSDGDLGTYTKFNYSKVSGNYQWRTPMAPGKVSFSEGLLSKRSDDKANYCYGVKELRYLHSIETRTHVAKIFLKDRDDALGVAGVAGDINTSVRQKCIDKIELYAKADLKNGKTEPIKTVHFEYDYSLCPLTPNSVANTGKAVHPDKIVPAAGKEQGKLTLKRVYFTYGRANKGFLNPYVFKYSDQNPVYSHKDNDRWGNYKKLPAGSDYENNAYFSYVDQNKTTTDVFASVYALTEIYTPTGGYMKVFYESDDYGYVQDKQAMAMFNILGFTNSKTDLAPGNTLYADGGSPKEYICVDLGKVAVTPENFRNKYLKGLQSIYFSIRTQVINTTNLKENVSGYADINLTDCHVEYDGTHDRYIGYVKTNSVSFSNKTISPMMRAAWMYARMNLQREVYGSADATDGAIEQVVGSIKSMGNTLISTLALGFGGYMIKSGNGKNTEATKSFARLNDPDKTKLGGGHRVKAVIMSDQWHEITTAEDDAFYGQTYDYTKIESGEKISSGVASYEPILGGDENPFRVTVAISERVKWAPPKEEYMEMPYGESYFPAAGVGYSKVTVTPAKVDMTAMPTTLTQIAALPSNGSGSVVNEFYTAKEFPTIARYTDLDTRRQKPSIVSQFMKVGVVDLVSCVQGYYIELNDMHGKPKKESVYASTNASQPISYVEHLYKLDNKGQLNNKVDVVDPALTISSREMGVDVDIIHDQRIFESSTFGGGLHFNIKNMIFGIIPVAVPTAFPDITDEFTSFRSLVTAKCVNKYAVEAGTIAMDNGSVISTTNLLWDKSTGNVLLTETKNEFHDPLYNFTYPGHWTYERMGQAAYNEGMIVNTNNTTGKALLRDGDEIAVIAATNPSDIGKIAHTNKVNSAITFLNKDGSTSTVTKGKVVRSGSRNMPNTPVGSVSMTKNPIAGNTLVFEQVLNAGASEFKEGWQKFCNCPADVTASAAATNPYITGQKGMMRGWKSYTYLTGRTQTHLNENVNIRKDGIFTDYAPFWTLSGGKLAAPAASVYPALKWQNVTEITKFNPVGMEIENKDALGRYSMAQFGYGRNLPVATSNNSQYRETGYDGFEDYNYGDCNDNHLSWRKASLNGAALADVKPVSTFAHTGRQSIVVPKSSNLQISKIIVPCDNPAVVTTTTTSSSAAAQSGASLSWWFKFWHGFLGTTTQSSGNTGGTNQ